MAFIVHHPCYTAGRCAASLLRSARCSSSPRCSEPPQKEIDRAQGAIDAARAAGAEQYAAEPFSAATTAMQQTHEAVQQRDYRLALSRAIDANERALEAARQAANGKAKAQSDADAAITRASIAVRQLDERLKVAESMRLPARDLDRPESPGRCRTRTARSARGGGGERLLGCERARSARCRRRSTRKSAR